ncbi:hypothetical protein BCV72DRAFT_240338 [Rhizopus microsporus var. microsporus]|uniref:RNI-like protein n=1 Tax=Rhizopus microsporus var. microsporus TaxID=86635 RepID=A0A1X0R9F4_RHIZD|nr:hypothetical protein BCV72DRAFT_240338 [Rhizopus microsporus var. microsporus]
MTDDQQLWESFQFEEPKESLISLPTHIMEHICRLLDNRRDKYEACLIHRNWSIAAIKVLWEAPRFERPYDLRDFVKAVSRSKKLALLVEDLYLAYLDIPTDSVFKTVVRSTLDRHSAEAARPLADVKFIFMLAKLCENIQRLTCYGWQLEAHQLDQLATIAPKLTHLHIIGNNREKTISLSTLFPRLESLRLDGEFDIDDAWVTSLINRAIHLKDLQISLKNLKFSIVNKLCTPDCLQLEKLTITEAAQFKDNHTSLLGAFLSLKTLHLEASVTSQSVFQILNNCAYIQRLEIKGGGLPRGSDKTGSNLFLTRKPSLQVLLLENMDVADSDLQALGSGLESLQVVGLKRCPLVSNEGLSSLLSSQKHLKKLELVDCTNVESSFLSAIANSTPHLSCIKSVRDILIQSCGKVEPADIYQFCCNAIHHNIQSLKLYDYDIKPIAAFNSQNSPTNIVLNRASMDALIHTTDPCICPIPSDITLTGQQVMLLAKHLDLSTKELATLIEQIKQEDQQEQRPPPVTTIPLKKEHRISSLRESPRPTTPAIFSKDFNDNGSISVMNDEELTLGGWGVSSGTAKDFWSKPAESVPAPPKQHFRQTTSHYRNSPLIVEGDGWGEPSNYVPWDDLRTQGFAYEVLEEQKQTPYWTQKEDGQWVQLGVDDKLQNTTDQPKTDGNADRTASPLSFSAIHEATSASYENKNVSSVASVISTDESFDWDDINNNDEDIVVKVRPESPPRTKPTPVTNAESLRNTWTSPNRSSSDKNRKSNKGLRQNTRHSLREPIAQEQRAGRWKDTIFDNLDEPTFTGNNLLEPPPQQQQQQQTYDSNSTNLLVDLDDDKQIMWGSTSIPPPMSLNNELLLPNQPQAPKEKENKPANILFTDLAPGTTTTYDDKQGQMHDFNTLSDILTSSQQHIKEQQDTPSYSNRNSSSDIANRFPSPDSMQENYMNNNALVSQLSSLSSQTIGVSDNQVPLNSNELAGSSSSRQTNDDAPPSPSSSGSRELNNEEPMNDNQITYARPPTPQTKEDIKKYYKNLPNYLTFIKVVVDNDTKENRLLVMYMDEPLKETLQKFCEKYNCTDKVETLYQKLKHTYMKKHTQKIFKKSKRKDSMIPSAPVPTANHESI